MSAAPGQRELRWFALCAALAAMFSLSNGLVTVRAPLETVLLASRASLFFGGSHALAWFCYSAVQERRALRAWERVLIGVGVVVAILSLFPGALVGSTLLERKVAWLGVTYADTAPNTYGTLAYGFHLGTLAIVFVRYARRFKRGDQKATVQCITVGAVLVGALHDSLAQVGLIGGPYILDLTALVLVVAVGGSLTTSFVASARALEISAKNLASTQEQLVKRERLAALGELAAVVAHEVRNPLAVVFNATSGLRKATPGSEAHEALTGIIQEEAERLRDVVSDLLEFARPRPPVFAVASVGGVVTSAVGAACSACDAPEGAVVVDVETGVQPAVCDPRLVRQAVINLVTNALQTPDRREAVRVRVAQSTGQPCHGATLVIEVRDDGVGVPEDKRERIFTPFYSTRPSGTGLGLAVVRSSAEAHGGTVVVTETPGGGATFTMRLPWPS